MFLPLSVCIVNLCYLTLALISSSSLNCIPSLLLFVFENISPIQPLPLQILEMKASQSTFKNDILFLHIFRKKRQAGVSIATWKQKNLCSTFTSTKYDEINWALKSLPGIADVCFWDQGSIVWTPCLPVNDQLTVLKHKYTSYYSN